MRSTFAAAAFALFVVGLAAAQEKDAKPEKYVSKDGKYAVAFPDKPTVESKKAGGLDLNSATAVKGTAGFSVMYSDLPAEVVKASKPKELLDGGQKGIVGTFKAKPTSTRDFELGKQKYPAREIVGEKDAVNLRIQIILADNRLYQVFVVGPKETVTGKDADAFFQSFEITK
jgi:hypothetical protein